ncbi:MAG: AAA family ATPase [Deltaproteobacteria bacterium]|nr:AAA family ATPase [Deltaproteobacteria bacterium]
MLDRVPAIADAPRTRLVADAQARRTLAFGALRETLQRLGERHTVVLFLDDMQWADRDTTALLADLMRAPDPPAVLLVLATRTDESEAVLELVHRMDAEPTLLDLGPLPDDTAAAIAISHLGEDHVETASRLVREADGSPLVLIELTRYLQGHSLEEVAGKGLGAMLAERIDSLGEAARLVAEMVAVAGEPRAGQDRRVVRRRDGSPPQAVLDGHRVPQVGDVPQARAQRHERPLLLRPDQPVRLRVPGDDVDGRRARPR